MTLAAVIQDAVFVVVLMLLVKPTGRYLHRVFSGERTWIDPVLRPVERAVYRLLRVRPEVEMDWRTYATALVLFSLSGALLVYAILRLQSFWPGPPRASELATPMTPDLAMNTAISFSTQTTWQAYGGETTLKYASQIVGVTAQSFLASAAGLAVGIAFMRGLARQSTSSLGNFWVDVTRAILWVLLPIAILGGIVFIWQGMPMNFSPYVDVVTLEGGGQTIAQGPVAAFQIVETLGTNGGGFFTTNGAHPYEYPTPLVDALEMLAIAVIPAGLTHTFGRMVERPRAGWVLLGVMVFLFLVGIVCCQLAESAGNPAFAAAHVAGGNMEGKEVRFGIGESVLTAVVTSNGACGSVDSMHGSYTPLGVLIPLANMLLGEIVFGGLGTGMYSIIVVALVGLFLAGLMVGRTPEYLGKKIGADEVKVVMIYTLVYPLVILVLTVVALRTRAGLAGLTTNAGSRGFTEVLFAYTSSAANNGQNMAGLNARSPFYNVTTAVAMIVGRFFLAIPALALAGRLARQGRRLTTPGTLPSDSITFGAVALGAALLVGALCFFPAAAMGPILEHLELFR